MTVLTTKTLTVVHTPVTSEHNMIKTSKHRLSVVLQNPAPSQIKEAQVISFRNDIAFVYVNYGAVEAIFKVTASKKVLPVHGFATSNCVKGVCTGDALPLHVKAGPVRYLVSLCGSSRTVPETLGSGSRDRCRRTCNSLYMIWRPS